MTKVLRIVSNGVSHHKSLAVVSSNRLFRDIAEFLRDDYPGIKLHYVGEKPASNQGWCYICDRYKCGVQHLEVYACLELTPGSGPFKNIPLHFEIIIPDGYPAKPPRVSVSTAIKHPHVYGNWICADILQEWSMELRQTQTNTGEYTGGYTPAYTLFGVALQMLCFFTNETLENDHGGNHLSKLTWDWELKDILLTPYSYSNKRNSQFFECQYCGYSGSTIYEEMDQKVKARREKRNQKLEVKKTTKAVTKSVIGVNGVKQQKRANKTSDKEVYRLLLKIPNEIWLAIADLLPTASIPIATVALPVFRDVLKHQNVMTKRELRCFFTKLTHVEATLGFGVHVETEGSQNFMLSEFEYISSLAFNTHNVRVSVWKKPFEFFLPFAICDEHFTRSLTSLRSNVRKLGAKVLVPKYISSDDLDRPSTALLLLIKMMNNIVVSLFRVAGSNKERHVLVAASEKAVQGYVSILHIVLSLMNRYEAIAEEIEDRVEQFVTNPECRLKEYTPDIGEWLIYLGLSQKYSWNHDVAKTVILQFLSRTVMWMLRKHVDNFPIENFLYPYVHLAFLEREPVCEIRLTDTFMATQTSLRLMLFQVFFLTKILRPTEATTNTVIYNALEKSLGKPKPEMLTSAFNAIKTIQSVDSFGSFFKLVGAGYERFNKSMVCTLLKNAIMDSKKFGYHQLPRYFGVEGLLEYRRRALRSKRTKRFEYKKIDETE
ncbi:hypothetical protein HK098_007135 [Nowakowskiella sp. JEL0407]|nr:hypothetical protein HK098_007135 [Nowakowskiella sp. JEL0407]